ncbi:ComF family protein [Sphingomonas sp. RB1R13]|uniref:ComF family protein n=1 Tax=Sphingomonas sp. RB1R13 TaxID=3096159 RepID=UPI002FCC06EB
MVHRGGLWSGAFVTTRGWIVAGGRVILDFALPPRCPGCGAIVEAIHSFCPPCWTSLNFLGNSGCVTCGIPLAATDSGTCAACLARPPLIARTRAAVEYGDIARTVAIRLKYGRKIALAKAMARFMAPLLGDIPADALLVPVPLHRRRLASRGFNQSLLVARELGRMRGLEVAPRLLRRTRATPPLKGMNFAEREKTVRGAFAVREACDGRTLILIDDVLTTGSTANACARTLKRAGATHIELLCWSRVVRNPIFVA